MRRSKRKAKLPSSVSTSLKQVLVFLIAFTTYSTISLYFFNDVTVSLHDIWGLETPKVLEVEILSKLRWQDSAFDPVETNLRSLQSGSTLPCTCGWSHFVNALDEPNTDACILPGGRSPQALHTGRSPAEINQVMHELGVTQTDNHSRI
ncbi:hypothetical protein Y1Q_0008060 [Alligator mississippiensis]|uniref:Uncharacterized protein n=1 Tax=Alligator mississippiensis TaxID=8496 RepID=A0A151NG45_ALLMI|nr:hypothetical protein Y1Q_0008060 [Alligator mississippiensis]